MPLSPPAERKHLHTRRYHFEGFERADGLWDIEGRMIDVKTYGFDNSFRGRIVPGTPLHDMIIRLTVDTDFVVRDIEASTDWAPYQMCGDITPNFKRMIGTKVSLGWRTAIRQNLGGVEGCTHLVEMLGAMATVAFQTIYPKIAAKLENPNPAKKPGMIDSCHAYRSDGEIVKRIWPSFYTGN